MNRGLWMVGLVMLAQGPATLPVEERLARHRNLGKAFYENPTTQNESVGEFRRALELAPGSTREKLNLGLALLRAANNVEGLKWLEEVQKAEPKLPHTWFNLGIHWKKQGESEKAVAQFRELVRLAPQEPKAHYNLAASLRLGGNNAEALKSFEVAARLDPGLAAARFQLYNSYRQAGRMPEAQAALKEFQRLKKEQEGAAIPEDVDWCDYAEIYDPMPVVREIPVKPVWQLRSRVAGATGFTLLDAMGAGRPQVLAWGAMGLRLDGVAVGGALKDVVSAAAGDFDNDGLADVAVVTAGQGPVLLKNQRGGRFAPVTVAWPKGGSYRMAVWIDFDHDYDLDLVLLGADAAVMRNQGAAGFVEVANAMPFVKGVATAARWTRKNPDGRGFDLEVSYEGGRNVLYRDQLGGVYKVEAGTAVVSPVTEAAVDLNGDGVMDRVRVEAAGVVAEVDTAKQANAWVRIGLTGVRNLKAAQDAFIEVKAGTLYRRQRYEGYPLTFNVGAAREIDTVRITWANGLIQNETKVAVNRAHVFKEAQRLSGSCPIIWTWDGEGFRYITDVLGVAPLGAAAGDGTYFATDHDEYVQIAGEALRVREGEYEIRVTEELSEAAYVDEAQLIAVDHPATERVYTNEKWKSPPFPEFKLWGVRDRIAPQRAVDHDGTDVTAKVAGLDQTYPDGFRRTMSGIAEMHTLELDFGRVKGDRALLVAHGWVDWADGSTFLQVAQEGKGGLAPPKLQVRDAKGEWVTVIEDMGMPAGKPKTIAVDLSGLWKSDSRAVRIVTNLCVYWDEIFLATDFGEAAGRRTVVPLKGASLRFRGFSPSVIHPERKQPERFVYEGATPTSLWNPTPGLYTRYGEVGMLLERVDERLVVMGSGDEIRLRFDAGALPALPAGWRRDFLLKVDGWAKDRDANTWNGQSVQPLPFHKMSGYPYSKGERHPDGTYDREFNTRPALRLLRPLAVD